MGQVVTFNGDGFFEFTYKMITHKVDATIDIEIHVTTSVSEGLLLWKRSPRYKDYISLGIIDGFVKFEYYYNNPDKMMSVQSTVRVNDGHLHVIKVGKQKGGDCFLQVDTQEEIRRVGRLGPGDR